MASLPFNRQTSRDLLTSAEDKGRALKSSLTEGSSRLFGSVMGAKKGLMGGLTSTFDHVVSIVGGGGDKDVVVTGGENGGTMEGGETSSIDSGASTPVPESSKERTIAKARPPKPPAPPARQRSDVSANGGDQNSPTGGAEVGGRGGGGEAGAGVAAPGGVEKTIASPGWKISRQNTDPTGYGGAASVPGISEARQGAGGKDKKPPPPLKRRNTNPFMDDYDPSVLEPPVIYPSSPLAPQPQNSARECSQTNTASVSKQTGNISVSSRPGIVPEPTGVWNNGGPSKQAAKQPRGENSDSRCEHDTSSNPNLPSGNCVRKDWEGVRGREGGNGRERGKAEADESDAESDATEGCDEERGTGEGELLSLDGLDCEEGISSPSCGSADKGAVGIMMSGSKESDQPWTATSEGDLANDPQTRACIEFMKYFVKKIFYASCEIQAADKSKFGELIQTASGRLWFAKCVSAQRSQSSGQVLEEVLYTLVQFFAVVLFECNESEDYLPATTLLNVSLTVYHRPKDTSTGKLPRQQLLYTFLRNQSIWQSPRFWNAAFFYAVQQERSMDQKQRRKEETCRYDNITFQQLGIFTSNMRSLGLTKEQCCEFIRRQSKIANLPQTQINLLRGNMELWTPPSDP